MSLPPSCAIVEAGGKRSTGFFVATDVVATCAHTVHPSDVGDPVTVHYHRVPYDGNIIWKQPPKPVFSPGEDPPRPDVALILVRGVAGVPVRFRERTVEPNERLQTYGFPENGIPDGEPSWMVCSGQTYDTSGYNGTFYALRDAQLPRGFSGSPLALADGTVVGMITISNSPSRVAGGIAVPIWAFLEDVERHVDVHIVGRQKLEVPPSVFAPEASPSSIPAPSTLKTATSILEAEREERIAPTHAMAEEAESAPVLIPPLPTRAPPYNPASQDAVQDVDAIDRLRARGLFRTALARVNDVIDSAAFSLRPIQQRAQALRLKATLSLEVLQAVDVARTTAAQARELEPTHPKQRIIDSLLVAVTEGREAAISALHGDENDVRLQRAGYHLELNDPVSCVRLIEELPPGDRDDPKALRLLARAALLMRDRPSALRHVSRALEVAPDVIWTLMTAADVYLQQAVPPALWLSKIHCWPQPVPGDVVVDTPDARAYLALSRELFERILADAELGNEEMAWEQLGLLAANAYDLTRREEAAAIAGAILAPPGRDYRAIHWVRTLHLDVDVEPALAALREREHVRDVDAESVILLAIESSRASRGKEAEAILRRNEALFADSEPHAQWSFFLIEALIEQKRFSQARAEAESRIRGHAGFDDVVSLIVRAEAEETGDRTEVKAALEARYREERNPVDLLSRCEIAAEESDWPYVARYSEELFENLTTPKAARLALYALYNVGSYEDVVDLYNRYHTLAASVPIEVRRVYAFALARLGRLEANAEMEAIVAVRPTEENILALGRLQALRGDYAALEITARLVERLERLDPKTALFFAAWLRLRDRELARSLWRAAMVGDIPDELIALAFTLGHQLDLDPETAPLVEAMQRLGSEGAPGIRLISQAEGLEVLRESAKRSSDLGRAYRRGELPVHFLCASTNIDIVQTHVETPRLNIQREPKRWIPIYIRHGSRATIDARLPATPVLDSTTYLLMEAFDFVEKVFKRYQTILVPSVLPQIIALAADERAVQQPALVDATARALDRLDREEVAYDDQVPGDAFNIDWTVPADGRQGPSPRDLTPRALIEALYRFALIGTERRNEALRTLGPAAGQNIEVTLPARSHILLRGNIVENLEQAGVLGVLAQRFRVIVEREWARYARAELSHIRAKRDVSEWLTLVVQPRLVRAHQSGKVRYINAPRSEGNDNAPLEVTSLLSIAAGTVPDEAFVICDDRYASSQPARDDLRPIVTTFEFLDDMRGAGAITDVEFFELLSRMRAGGLFYLGMTADEIEYQMRRATVVGGVLQETAELRTLRGYLAYALLDREALAPKDPQGPAAISQAGFLLQAGQAIREASARMLLSAKNEDDVSRVDWVLLNLAFDGLPGYNVMSLAPTEPVAETVLDSEVAAYLTRALTE